MVASRTQLAKAADPPHDAYPVRLVAKLTGLSADIIRAWEKRYAVVDPVRGPRGARLYSTSDIDRLRALAAAVAAGRSIGDVAHLGSAELVALAPIPVPEPLHATPGQRTGSNRVVTATLECLQAHDVGGIEMQLADGLVALGSRLFLHEVVVPLLHEVGDGWARGELSIAQEHLLSGVLRNLLTGMLRSRPRAPQSTLLLATPPGERHEFGLLLAALVARDQGVGSNYIGIDLPAAEIVDAAVRSSCMVVAISVVAPANRRNAVATVRELEAALPALVELWLGGADAAHVQRQAHSRRARLVTDLSALRDDLDRLVPKAAQLHRQAMPKRME